MSERLISLKRQRHLMEEHLRWLDDEIASESGEQIDSQERGTISPFPSSQPEAKPNEPYQAPTAAAYRVEETSDEVEEISDQLISQYGYDSTRREMDPRLGLVLFFGGILGFLGLVVFLFYWFGYR